MDSEQAETLAEEYDYPGALYTDLHNREIFDEFELPVDVNVDELHREMSVSGFTYYTGKELYKRESRGDPPDRRGYRFPEPEKEDEVFDYLGRTLDEEQGDVVHYFRTTGDAVEVERHLWNLEGELEERLAREHFWYMPATKLQMYVDEYDWVDLDEPDWKVLKKEYGFESRQKEVDLEVEETEQAGFDEFL